MSCSILEKTRIIVGPTLAVALETLPWRSPWKTFMGNPTLAIALENIHDNDSAGRRYI